MSDLNYFFLQLQLQYKVDLIERKSVIIFDEVQLCPYARQAIKTLVKDGRYDYIETGSLISIKKMWKIFSFQVKKENCKCIQWILKNFFGLWMIILLWSYWKAYLIIRRILETGWIESWCVIFVYICW